MDPDHPHQDFEKKDEAEVKAEALAVATGVLSSRVQTLADVVQTNNRKIDELQKEVNCKPDDSEVQFIAGLAQQERKKHYRGALGYGVLAAVISGAVGFGAAEIQGQARCKVNAQNINTIVKLLEQADNPRLQPTIDDLKSNRNDC